jgi:hypothetical protein
VVCLRVLGGFRYDIQDHNWGSCKLFHGQNCRFRALKGVTGRILELVSKKGKKFKIKLIKNVKVIGAHTKNTDSIFQAFKKYSARDTFPLSLYSFHPKHLVTTDMM